jgi:hypothetical protein
MQGTWMVLLALILGTFGELGEHGGARERAPGLFSERVSHGGVSEKENAEPGPARRAEAGTKALGASGEPQDTGVFASASLSAGEEGRSRMLGQMAWDSGYDGHVIGERTSRNIQRQGETNKWRHDVDCQPVMCSVMRAQARLFHTVLGEVD